MMIIVRGGKEQASTGYLIDNNHWIDLLIRPSERQRQSEIESPNKLMNHYAEPVICLNQFKLIDGKLCYDSDNAARKRMQEMI